MKLYQGNCLEILKNLGDESVDMVMTSPPYWSLRDYGIEGQLGLEADFEEYIKKLCDIFDEVKRVLKKNGTCWINIGDTYGGSGVGTSKNATPSGKQIYQMPYDKNMSARMENKKYNKCLLQIPSRFAIEMCDRGWILRNEIIWHKPNCMPSSVKDRFTVNFEKIYFFVKSRKYYFERQIEPYKNNKDMEYRKRLRENKIYKTKQPYKNNTPFCHKSKNNEDLLGRNKRCIWRIQTQPFKDAHFATYPEKLCENPIKAGCDVGGVVLDPFCGAGTTGVAAIKLNRDFIGIEINSEYLNIARARLENTQKNIETEFDLKESVG
jgi:site-specific DNA-methyltransferase (adenine-specific)